MSEIIAEMCLSTDGLRVRIEVEKRSRRSFVIPSGMKTRLSGQAMILAS